eukprot:GHVN01068552.1.p2 GENE.GHVN01068552.1~~GHVN01068552.1.p2  ORF type:complete len:345 (-),score=21.42 GHVN01068552.1:73-1107(-)
MAEQGIGAQNTEISGSLRRDHQYHGILKFLSNMLRSVLRAQFFQVNKSVSIVEVGPRDGLQNESQHVPTATKLELIRKLVAAGLRRVEATAFVNPNKVPQMGDHKEVMAGLPTDTNCTFPVLVPNMKGYEAAKSFGATEVAVFASASESFSQRNTNCSVDESLTRFKPIFEAAMRDHIKVRGYVSCVMGCPYEGDVSLLKVSTLTRKLLSAGCFEVSLGDTIGVGTPGKTEALLKALEVDGVPTELIAAHFHDTYGQALANVLVALSAGVTTLDSSVGGLGGCPFAKGATGNVATEDLVYMLKGMGVNCGVDMDKLLDVSAFVIENIGVYHSRAGRALLAARQG